MSNSVICIDTNILIDNPKAVFGFPDSLVVIPSVVLEELDKLKDSKDSNVRRQSRITSHILDDVTEKNIGKVDMLMDNGGYLRIETDMQQEFESFEPSKPDNRIISVAVGYAKKGCNVILYSNDINVRVQLRRLASQIFGSLFAPDEIPLKAKRYELIDSSLHDIDSGVREIVVDAKYLSECRDRGYIEYKLPYLNGEHIVLQDEYNPKHQVLAQYDSINKRIVRINDYKKGEPLFRIGRGKEGATDVRPRDARQCFLANDIMDTSKNLHFVLSKVAGAGKSFLVTACSLNLLNNGYYDKLIVVKPMIPVDGADIGFLPGEKESKISPFFESFNDTMYELTNDGQGLTDGLEERIELEVITFMRGRSIPNIIMIIDEAQNLSELAIKTLLTRIGENAKVVIMGDLSQIDNFRLDSSNCGLRVWSERARKSSSGYDSSTYILLESNFRSPLSAWASSFYE